MAARDKTAPQLAIVVDLTVEDNDFRAVFIEYRLLSAAQVDDTQSSHPEAHSALHEEALLVRAAMLKRRAQALQQCPRDRPIKGSVGNAGNTNNGWAPLCKSDTEATPDGQMPMA